MTPNLRCVLCDQKIGPIPIELCDKCKKEIEKAKREIFVHQPKPDRKLDQFSMDFESILSQLIFMKRTLIGKTISFFGGYDGIGLLSKFFGTKSVVVFDLDSRVLEWWKKTGTDYNLDVFTIYYDAREPLTTEIVHTLGDYPIEAWRSDPPYNCAGMFCFLSRICYLNRNQAPLFLSVPTGSRWSQLLKWNLWNYLKKNRMKITDVSPDLCFYLHLEGSASSTWRIENLQDSITENKRFEYDIYHATQEFAQSSLGCKQYESCRARRNEWESRTKN